MRKTVRGFFIFLMVSGLSGCVIEQPEPEPEPEPAYEYEFTEEGCYCGLMGPDPDGYWRYQVAFKNTGTVYIEYVEVLCTFHYESSGLDNTKRTGSHSEIAPEAHTVLLFKTYGGVHRGIEPDKVTMEVTYIR